MNLSHGLVSRTLARFLAARNLKLNDHNIAGRKTDHVDTPTGCGHLSREIDANVAQDGDHDTLIGLLRESVGEVVPDACKKRRESADETGTVSIANRMVTGIAPCARRSGVPGIGVSQPSVEPVLHLVVGEAQGIGTAAPPLLIAPDGQVAGLEKDGGHEGVGRLKGAQLLLGDFDGLDLHGLPLGIRHEPAGRSRLEPVRADVGGVQATTERNGVEHAGHGAVEAVSVIHVHQARERPVDIGAEGLCEGREPPRETRPHLVVRVAQQAGETNVHRDVGQVVEV